MASFRKNSREEVRVSVDEFRGHELLNIRVWFEADDGEMRPGKQGIALRLELLPELREALERAGQVSE
ncbi:MAG: transcriptional coactivator p15/PC4 family protein [Rhodovulum sp.]|nr:transcriptional coactivator p15/PC4 family protein [Rhodovulum sp.]